MPAGKRKLVLAEQSHARTSLMSRSPVSSLWVPQRDDCMPVIWDDAPGAQIRGVSHSSCALRRARLVARAAQAGPREAASGPRSAAAGKANR
jgi:hypothetical protein